MGISVWQLLIVLAIVLLLFGTKKLKNLGGDLGDTIRNFKKAVKEGEEEGANTSATLEKKDADKDSTIIEGEVSQDKDKT
ncbi:MAG: twin-arginine translocase TatA/TatE family subunit [Chromatiales bacterium]|nr:twin-arginine translocase TatA/TatE family subunit [Gammaproteobacteria bacterium]MBW6475989.1 twin-arginine translocase TatA/TatE family subunit [Chromatiales bacterium]